MVLYVLYEEGVMEEESSKACGKHFHCEVYTHMLTQSSRLIKLHNKLHLHT